MKRLFTAAILGLCAHSALASETVSGRPSVVDGDTIVIHGVRIRLFGIDAPESSQVCRDEAGANYRCGQRAALALADLIGSSPLTCEARDTDRYRRTVAVCRQGATDINAWMVKEGHAVAYRQYSLDYVDAEISAKSRKAGIWAGSFQEPAQWRRDRSAGKPVEATASEPVADIKPSPAKPTADGCLIKGNINRRGDRIYHIPGSRDYDKTIIAEADGERMFCSEEEAKAAGWRAPHK